MEEDHHHDEDVPTFLLVHGAFRDLSFFFFFPSPAAGRQSKMKNTWSHLSTSIPCTCLEV